MTDLQTVPAAGPETAATAEGEPVEIPAEIAELGYSAAFAELEQIRAELESGRLDVDEVAERVGRARLLREHCLRKVTAAEFAVRQILSD